MTRHIHVHLHGFEAEPTGEVHWHFHLEPASAQQRFGVAAENVHGGFTFNVNITNPPNDTQWNVRPPSSGSIDPGLICANGTALVGSDPAMEIWAYIFHRLPSMGDLQNIHPDAVCGEINTSTGVWRFHHGTSPCSGGPASVPGRLGTEIPRALHSAAATGGTANWLVVWGKRGTEKSVDVRRFLGVTSTATSCGGSSALVAVAAEPAATPPPLPAVIMATYKTSARKLVHVLLEYAAHSSQSGRPIWQSSCGMWKLSIEKIDESFLAQLDGRWPVKDQQIHVRWSGIVSLDRERNTLEPIAPEDLPPGVSVIELEETTR